MKLYHFTKCIYALDAIRNQHIHISRFSDLNDPFELYAAEMTDRVVRDGFKRFKRYFDDRFGLICLSKRWKSPLLWSHYADKHRGVALEFEVSDEKAVFVTYSPHRLLSYMERRLQQGPLSEGDAYELMTTKFDGWKYEEEARLVVPLSTAKKNGSDYFQEFEDGLRLTGIILGSLCELTQRELIDALPKGVQLKLTKARLAFRTFNVVRNRAASDKVLIG